MVNVSRTLTALLVEYYGTDHQMLKVAEELSELQTVILQAYTKTVYAEEMYSEVADVYIMLDQLVHAVLDEDRRNLEIKRKLNRQFERLKNEQRKKETVPEEEDIQ